MRKRMKWRKRMRWSWWRSRTRKRWRMVVMRDRFVRVNRVKIRLR